MQTTDTTTGTIIFDLGGVIINTKTDKEWLEENLLKVFQKEPLGQLMLQNYLKHYETGKITTAEFIRKMKEIANEDCTLDQIIKNWNGILKDIPEERVTMLQRLKSKYRLILMSNTNEIHLEAIEKYMQEKFGRDILKENFHHCYYSFEAGYRKPHKEFHEYVLQKENLNPESCLYIDDRQENLVEPSKLKIRTQLADREIVEILKDY
jgi:putative hydrolase of the HAD superfamily